MTKPMTQAQDQPKLLLTVAQVCARLQFGENRVREMIAAGELPHVRLKRSIRVPTKAVDEWIDAQTGTGATLARTGP